MTKTYSKTTEQTKRVRPPHTGKRGSHAEFTLKNNKKKVASPTPDRGAAIARTASPANGIGRSGFPPKPRLLGNQRRGEQGNR